VRSTDVERGESIPFRVVPEGDQVPENVSEPVSKKPRDIFHEHESGS